MGRPPKTTRSDDAKKMASDEYVSQFFIDPDNLQTDQFHYRWVETHCLNQETQSLNHALRAGYEPVKLEFLPEFAKTAELMAAIRGRGKGDEYVRSGDQILMRCNRKLYEDAKKAERKNAKDQMKRVDWAAQAQAISAPTFVSENQYSRTQQLSAAAAKAFADDEE